MPVDRIIVHTTSGRYSVETNNPRLFDCITGAIDRYRRWRWWNVLRPYSMIGFESEDDYTYDYIGADRCVICIDHITMVTQERLAEEEIR